MKVWSAMVLGSLTLSLLFVTVLRADDKPKSDKEKIVGTWEVQKGQVLSKGMTLDFKKDGTISIARPAGRSGGKANKTGGFTVEGTYKLDGDKLTMTMKFGDAEQKQSFTIKSITDKKLVMTDPQDKDAELQKKDAK